MNPHWHEIDADWKAARLTAFLDAHDVSPTSLADVGCGTAGVIRRIVPDLPDGCRVVGFEPSADGARVAREKAGSSPGFELVQGMPGEADHFDVLMALDVLEHVQDPIAWLEDLHQHADRFVFHIPLDLSAQGVARRAPLTTARNQLGHLHYFTAELARATLGDAGYEILADRFEVPAAHVGRDTVARRVAALPRRIGMAVSPSLTARTLGGCSLFVLAR